MCVRRGDGVFQRQLSAFCAADAAADAAGVWRAAARERIDSHKEPQLDPHRQTTEPPTDRRKKVPPPAEKLPR